MNRCRPSPFQLLDESNVERLHRAGLTILAESGIEFKCGESLDILARNGATVRGETARFDPDLVEHYVANAPGQFVQLARNPANNVAIGGRNMVCAPVYGAPFVHDMAGGRRPATLADTWNFARLTQACPYLHHAGGTVVEPTDRPVATRHLDVLEAHIACTDKPFMGSANGRAAAADSVAIAEILFGADAIRHQPALLSLINSNSPRRYDGRMLEALIVYARARQALVITPFISAGVTGPVTIAGSIAQQHAEVLAGIALVQMISPGAPVVYGSFLTTGDMRTGGPVFTAPEFQLALCAGAQLARRCRVPFRGGGMLTGAKLPDAQAAIQSMTAMSATVMAGTHFVLHAAGWLDGGLVAGYEKFVLDCEALGMMHAWHQGLDVSDESLALGDIAEVAPGGHYLETEKTLTCCHNAFHQTPLFENDHFMGWQAAGGADAYKRAAERVRHLLGACPPPRPLSPDIELALRDYIARRDDHPGFAA